MTAINATERVVNGWALPLGKPGQSIVLVDSALASHWLTRNHGNRHVRDTLVDYLARQIASGEWRDDHPVPIVFSRDGILLDGQHRLAAIAKAGCVTGVLVRVETGADPSLREYLDTGVVRSLSDRVAFAEEPAVNRTITQLIGGFGYIAGCTGGRRPTPDEAKAIFRTYKDAMLWIASVKRKDRAVGSIPVCVAACEYYTRAATEAMAFYPALYDPETPIQQAKLLRDWLLRNAQMLSGRANRLNAYRHAVGCMKAHLEGRKVTRVCGASW